MSSRKICQDIKRRVVEAHAFLRPMPSSSRTRARARASSRTCGARTLVRPIAFEPERDKITRITICISEQIANQERGIHVRDAIYLFATSSALAVMRLRQHWRAIAFAALVGSTSALARVFRFSFTRALFDRIDWNNFEMPNFPKVAPAFKISPWLAATLTREN
jgi:hypothetical protein